MIDYQTQSRLVDATAAMLRSYLTATTNTLAATTWRGLSLWAEMAGIGLVPRWPAAGERPTLWPSALAGWMTVPRPYAWQAWPWSLTGNGMGLAPLAGAWSGRGFAPGLGIWAPMPEWGMWGRTPLPIWSGWLAPGAAPAAAESAAVKPAVSDPAPYASYRSAGGHATAQVIVPGIVPAAEIAPKMTEAATAVVLGPMQTMLGVWRAALGR
jgi:hypothetical protein